jgi:ABC-type lipoprotein export system ATPase subunit
MRTSPPGPPLAEARSLSKTYGTGTQAVVALHGATCAVRPGARIAITGPSGSGKSTLLHLLAGLEEPTAGTVTWPALGDSRHRRPGLIGMVFQGPSLLPPLDVTENVALPLILAGAADLEAHRRALAALDTLGIADLAGKLPEELSGGQSQRVAVARVLASRPDLIVADEPTGQLDHTTAGHVMTVMIAAADELGAALVVATHDPRVAALLHTRWTVHAGAVDTSSTQDAAATHDRTKS